MNSFSAIGNLGADPILTNTQSGTPFLKFRLAVDHRRRRTGPDGKVFYENQADWFNCVVYGDSSVSLAKHLQKGSKVCIQGSIHPIQYSNDAGVQHTVEVRVRDVEFISNIRSSTPVDQTEAANA